MAVRVVAAATYARASNVPLRSWLVARGLTFGADHSVGDHVGSPEPRSFFSMVRRGSSRAPLPSLVRPTLAAIFLRPLGAPCAPPNRAEPPAFRSFFARSRAFYDATTRAEVVSAPVRARAFINAAAHRRAARYAAPLTARNTDRDPPRPIPANLESGIWNPESGMREIQGSTSRKLFRSERARSSRATAARYRVLVSGRSRGPSRRYGFP